MSTIILGSFRNNWEAIRLFQKNSIFYNLYYIFNLLSFISWCSILTILDHWSKEIKGALDPMGTILSPSYSWELRFRDIKFSLAYFGLTFLPFPMLFEHWIHLLIVVNNKSIIHCILWLKLLESKIKCLFAVNWVWNCILQVQFWVYCKYRKFI